MNKLPTGALKQIPQGQVKTFLSSLSSETVSDYNNLVREYVQDVLEWDNTKSITQQDFDLMEAYFGDLQKYEDILQQYGIKTSASMLETVVGLCGNEKAFRSLLRNENILFILESGKSSIFNCIVKLYNITTSEEFESLLEDDKIRSVLIYGKEENFKLVVNSLKITTSEELKELLEDVKIRLILRDGKEENFKLVVKLYNITTSEELKELWEDEKIRKVLIYGKEENFKLVVKLYNITTSEELESLLEDDKIRSILIYGKEESFKFIVKLYNITTPRELEKLLKNKNIREVIYHYDIPDNMLYLLQNKNIDINLLKNFFNKFVSKSTNATNIIFENKIQSDYFKDIASVFLKYKQKSFVKFIQDFSNACEFGLGLDEDEIFGDLTDIQNVDVEQFIETNKKYISEKEKGQLLKTIKNRGDAFEKIIGNVIIKKFYDVYEEKWVEKMEKELHLKYSSGKVLERIKNPLFIEAYKMSLSPDYNKKQIKTLLKQYLEGEFDDVSQLHQYHTSKNKVWLSDNLSSEQQSLWLSKNEKVISLEDESKEEQQKQAQENREQKIQDHMQTANKKIQEINEKGGFTFFSEGKTSKKLLGVFNTKIKKQKEEIIKKVGDNLYNDLLLQIESIEELKKESTEQSKNIASISISRELDPFNCLMMGNWVQGSCLSFYSSVKNYWSAISNTIDANKGVYYIRDPKGKVLARFVLTIGEDKKLTRYKLYYATSVSFDANKIVDEYVKELGGKLHLELNGEESKVKNIECEEWHKDSIVTIT